MIRSIFLAALFVLAGCGGGDPCEAGVPLLGPKNAECPEPAASAASK